jgi:hypothetical protein
MKSEVILDAIIRANKLGAKGVQVVNFIEPSLTTQDDLLFLVVKVPSQSPASEKAWYED